MNTIKKFLFTLFFLSIFAGINAQEPPVNRLYDGGLPSIPKPTFGQYTVGDDYFLANYQQLLQYLDEVVKVSDRINVQNVGTTTEGRPFKLIVISSPENLANLEEYRQISVRLGKAEGLTDEQARELAAKGKAIVWIDAGLHSVESVNAQALFTQVYDLLARNDQETLRILDNVILLLAIANPDGMDLLSDWYMQESDPERRNMNIPRLYQKYIGHDNNRDSYMANQIETQILNRLLFIDWIPQITYNQHQHGPTGTVLYFPPFRGPFNHNNDPLVHIGIDLVGSAVHHRFLEEGKGGAVKHDEAPYSTWFNGGVRTTVGFHNQIGLMHEINGGPTPITITLVPERLVAHGNNPMPLGPRQTWHLHQSIDYVITANRAILDIAAKKKEDFLFRIYRAGKNSIERGSTDHWTITPQWVDRLNAEIAKFRVENPNFRPPADFRGRGQYIPPELFYNLQTAENRDPRGYIVPSDQPDFITATRFINILQKAGVDVHRATTTFTVAGKTYPAGSYVVKAAQAFRPHIRDMFEPQDHPNEFQYPGGPPIPPYDMAGYTPALQMGIVFDRILDNFDGPFEKIQEMAQIPVGTVSGASRPAGYIISSQVNDAFVAITRLLTAGEEVFRLQEPLTVNRKTYPAGTVYIPAKNSTAANVQRLASDLGLDFEAISAQPRGDALKLSPVRVALWDTYGGSMPSGWMRWILEVAFPFPSFEVVYSQALDAGNLRAKYDVIILPTGAFPTRGTGGGGATALMSENIPAQFHHMLGRITLDRTAPLLRQFVEQGGTVIAIGTSAEFGRYLGLPIANALADIMPDGSERPFAQDKYFVPGSVLRAKVDNTNPVAYGIPEELDIIFLRNNPVFRLLPEAKLQGLKPVSWFADGDHLRSGWAWGQHYLNNGTIAIEAPVGNGKVLLFGNEITFRAQPHASFKFLFNSIYYAGATQVRL